MMGGQFSEEVCLIRPAPRSRRGRALRPAAAPLQVVTIFGTRPEAIKLAPLIRRFHSHPARFRCTTVVTSQHRKLLDQALALFSIRPDHDLNILRPRQSPAAVMCRALAGLEDLLARLKPDFVVVQGDTSTTLAGALAAFYQKIRLVHVEAGLRTRSKYFPFPEEVNRRLTTVLADAHCAPTISARENLRAEGVPRDRIFVTGNTGIDALFDVLKWQRRRAHPALRLAREKRRRMVLVTSHRRENQGRPQEAICSALLRLAAAFPDILLVFPVHLSPAVRETILPRLETHDRIVLLDPLDYFETIQFMRAAFFILTDSGGIQEEAPALGKPVLVLRDATERPEGVAAGVVRLVGTDPEDIFAAAAELLTDRRAYRRMSVACNPYGDGRAAERILQVLEFIAGRGKRPAPYKPGGSR
jgi:UDP-N-acetylglucosamine 2-epimerase (non-hydrolysing)